MTKVDINRLKGNYAEHLVSTWLSEMCLVRPVAEGTDIGVDLYCEAVIENEPFLHFWAQVKAIGNKNLFEKDGVEHARFSFETKHLHYWAKQPIPVYAFLVPVKDWPPIEPNYVFGIKISEHIVRNGIPKKMTVTIDTSEGMSRDNRFEDLTTFVEKIVPWDTSIVLLSKGIIAPISKEEENIGLRYPEGIGKKYLEIVLRSIYDTATWIGIEAIEEWDSKEINKQKDLLILVSIVETFHKKYFHQLGLRFLLSMAKKRNDINSGARYKLHAEKLVKESKEFDENKKKELMEIIGNLFSEIF